MTEPETLAFVYVVVCNGFPVRAFRDEQKAVEHKNTLKAEAATAADKYGSTVSIIYSVDKITLT